MAAPIVTVDKYEREHTIVIRRLSRTGEIVEREYHPSREKYTTAAVFATSSAPWVNWGEKMTRCRFLLDSGAPVPLDHATHDA